MSLSLCTYTFNDAELVHGLLEHVRTWTIQPSEIVVTDDGSSEPFAPVSPDPRLRILRLPENRGFATAKTTGLGAATGEVVLSLDCDMRLAPDWLRLAMPHLNRAGVGLVAGRVAGYRGLDLVSRYLSAFDVCEELTRSGPARFVPGMVFLMRAATWREVGGFGDLTRRFGEDHALCQRLLAHGFEPYVEAGAVAQQTRRLSRAAMCRRSLVWCRESLAVQMPGEPKTIPYLFEVAAKPMLRRIDLALGLNEPLFLYLDLLYLAALTLSLLDLRPDLDPRLAQGFRQRLTALLSPYSRLSQLFRADLLRLGLKLTPKAQSAEAQAPAKAWEDFFMFATPLIGAGYLDWLDMTGMDTLLAEDRAGGHSFSAYEGL